MQEGDDEIFVYMGVGEDVPLGVAKIRVDRSVKIIPDLAFSERENLVEVYLDEGVEKIGYGAFYNCKCLQASLSSECWPFSSASILKRSN